MFMQTYESPNQLTYTVQQNIKSSIEEILEDIKKTGVFQYLIVVYNSDGTIGRVMRGISFAGVVTIGLAPAFFGVSVDIRGPAEIVRFAREQLEVARAEHNASASQQPTPQKQILRN